LLFYDISFMASLMAATKKSTENPVVDETSLAVINGKQNRNPRSDGLH
jgi:hypothetical protein